MTDSYADSALRHSLDADRLASHGHFDGAGYLIGFAVECAIKHAIESTRPAAGAPHSHLPKLVEGARKALQGRRKHAIFTLLNQTSFMQGWNIEIRYSASGEVQDELFQRWRNDANRALAAASLKRHQP